MVQQDRIELPEARIHSLTFGEDFDRNIRNTGFNAVPDADGIKSSNGRTINELKFLVYQDLETFAALSEETKRKYHVDPTGQRGYTPDGTEQSGALRELRQHIMMARPIPEEHPLSLFQPFFYGQNLPINHVPLLVPHGEELLECLDQLTLKTFEAVEKHLELAFGTLAAKLVRGQSFLRAHIYPAADEVVKEHVLNDIKTIDGATVNGVQAVDIKYGGTLLQKVVRASPHPDMGYFTWLLGSQVGGLNIQLADRKAMPFRTDPGSIVGNTADFIAKDVPGYPSTIHWVGMNAKTAKQPRLSLANFVHPRPTTTIGDKLAGVLIFERLYEIGYTFGEDKKDPEAVSRARDRLIDQVKTYPKDELLVPEILTWEQKALCTGIIPKPELGQYFHLTNSKTGTYERLR